MQKHLWSRKSREIELGAEQRGVPCILESISLDHQAAIATLAVMLIFKPDELPSNEGTYLTQVKMIFLLVAKGKWYTLYTPYSTICAVVLKFFEVS